MTRANEVLKKIYEASKVSVKSIISDLSDDREGDRVFSEFSDNALKLGNVTKYDSEEGSFPDDLDTGSLTKGASIKGVSATYSGKYHGKDCVVFTEMGYSLLLVKA